MNRRPQVSILLPVRDAAVHLAEALVTLLDQSFSDFEVLVQDDGSMDGSYEVALAAQQRDARVKPERQRPLGIVAALRRAAARAEADLLVRMDADDRARPERIERLVAAAKRHPDADFFASLVRYFPRQGLSEGMRRYEAWINGVVTHDAIVRDRFVECPLPHPAWAIRREVYERLGGYRDGPFPEDYDLFLRAASAGVGFHKVEEVLLDWREGQGRLSRTDPRYALDRFLDLKRAHLVPHLRRLGRDVVVVGAGREGKRWLQHLLESGLAVSHVVDTHPARVGQLLRGVRVIDWADLARARGAFLVVTLGRAESRDEARAKLDAAGFAEESDFLCV